MIFGLKWPWEKAKEKRLAEEKARRDAAVALRDKRRQEALDYHAAQRATAKALAEAHKPKQSFGIPAQKRRAPLHSVPISTRHEEDSSSSLSWDTPVYTSPLSYDSGSSASTSCDTSSGSGCCDSGSSSTDCGGNW